MTSREPKAVNPRKTAVLIPNSQITARVKGGKLNVISRPRPRKATPLSTALVNSRYRNSPFGQGQHRQAPVSLCVNSSHCKDDIILRKFQGGASAAANLLDVFPFRAGRGPPHKFILCRPSARRRLPGKRRVVLQTFGQQMHIGRRRRRRRQ